MLSAKQRCTSNQKAPLGGAPVLCLFLGGVMVLPAQAQAMGALGAIAVSSLTFVAGVVAFALLYVFARDKVEQVFERLSRSRFGSFMPHVFHRDSIADNLYGYYMWDRADGYEWISPYLRDMLGIKQYGGAYALLEQVFDAKDIVALSKAVDALKAKHLHEYHCIIKSRDGQSYYECFGIERNANYDKEGFTLWFRDVTGQVRERNALKADSRRLGDELTYWKRWYDHAPFPVWYRDSELNILYSNPAFRAIVGDGGAGERELAGQSRDLAEEAQKNGAIAARLLHIISGGKRTLYRATEVPLKNKRHGSVAYFGFATEMQELEAAENDLKRYMSAQGDFLESSASAMAVFGPDMKLKSYNNAFLSLWKLDEAWLEDGPGYGDILEALREKRKLPEQANFPVFKKQNLELFTTLIKMHEEFYYLPDGRVLRVLIIPHALGGLLFAYEDVTDRLALERNYNTLIAVQRATLDHLHEGVAVYGEHGRLTLCNPEYTKLWQLDEKMLENEPHISDVVQSVRPLLDHGDGWDATYDTVVQHVTDRSNRSGRLELTDGKVLDWRTIPLPDGATMVAYYDVTDSILVEETLRDKNKALEEADRVKKEFLASMSYELRSPLTSIMGFSEALEKAYFGDLNDKQKEYVSAINSSSHKLMSLINNILDLSSIEAGYMVLNLSHFSIKDVLEDVLAMQHERAKRLGIEIKMSCAKTIGKMHADETRIKQILYNLLHNAIKFSNSGSVVTIGAKMRDHGKQIELWIEDQGEGIPEEEQQQVFERFIRGASTKARKSGTGLGLSMVKRFTEIHGGTVSLESERGKGTRVACVIPREVKDADVPAHIMQDDDDEDEKERALENA